MRKGTSIPLEGFDPRLKELLTQGSVKRIDIPCESAHQRTALRNQLYTYRALARKENLPDAKNYYRASITHGGERDGKFWLTIAPRGSEFDKVLADLKSSSVVHTQPGLESSDPLDSFKAEDK